MSPADCSSTGHATRPPDARGTPWTPQASRPPLEFQPQVHPDGTFEVAFDAETLSLLFLDPIVSGAGSPGSAGGHHRRADHGATATYGGTLLDEKAQPLADRTLQL